MGPATPAKKLSSMMKQQNGMSLRTRKTRSVEPLEKVEPVTKKSSYKKQTSTSSGSTSVVEGSVEAVDEIQLTTCPSGSRKKLTRKAKSMDPLNGKGLSEMQTNTSSSASKVENGVEIIQNDQHSNRRSGRRNKLATNKVEVNNNNNEDNAAGDGKSIGQTQRKRAGKFFDLKKLRKQDAESDSNSSLYPSSGCSLQSLPQVGMAKDLYSESISKIALKDSQKGRTKSSANDQKVSKKSISHKLSEMHSSENSTQKRSKKRSSDKISSPHKPSAKNPTAKAPRRSTVKLVSYKESVTSDDDSDKDSDFSPVSDSATDSDVDSQEEVHSDEPEQVQAAQPPVNKTAVTKYVSAVPAMGLKERSSKSGKKKPGKFEVNQPKKSNQLVVGKVPFNYEALAKFKRSQKESTDAPSKAFKGVAAPSPATPSKMKSKVAKKRSKAASSTMDEDASSSDDDAADWEEVKGVLVHIKFVMYIYIYIYIYISIHILDLPTGIKSVQVTVDSTKEKKKGWDWFTYSQQLWRRYMKHEHEYRHKVELLCLLSSGQQLNAVCNDELFKALALSSFEKTTLKGKKCTEANIMTILSTIIKRVKLVPKPLLQSSVNSESLLDTFEEGLLSGKLHRTDELLLFVLGMLRALGASARLCMAWYPVPLRIAHFQKLQQIAKSEASGSKTKGKINFPFTPGISIQFTNLDSDANEQIWLEAYDVSAKKWLTIGGSGAILADLSEVEVKLSKPITYIVSYDNDGKFKDLTQKYDSKWMTGTAKLRVSDKWWQKTIAPYRPQESKKTKEEDSQLQNNLEQMPFPSTISGFKDHPLYALERHLLKFEAIYPRTAVPMGYTKTKEPIYSRSCVHELHSREQWLKEALQVKVGEEPYKFVKPRPSFKDWKNGIKRTEATLGTFGRWQTEPYVPATAENGIVPKNAYGNVDMYQPQMLPKGCVQIRIDSIGKIARKMGIDCAPAMVGWQLRSSANVPLFDGWVICKEFEDALLAAVDDYEEEEEKRAQEKVEKRVYGNWKTLIKGLLIRERLRLRYGKDNF
ncbi:DNA repair protein complementing XP-C cells homolog [Watersipora subatra]|uniref:DNA repair protein complementing XP-C cells homolog n=1 Tax=Watersipora subatra TaxID=2589382 RepID=UPI00355C5EC4